MVNVNIYGKSNKYIEDRPFGFCDNCKRNYKQRLNILQYSNMIQACVCDNCLKKGLQNE